MQANTMDEQALRRDIVDACKKIYERGWISATDGNVSVRLDEQRILTTPSGVRKGRMHVDDLIVVDMQGRKLSGTRGASSELRMHLAVYEMRSDVKSVVHAHPTHCIALSIAGVSLAQCLLPEVLLTFGSIPTADYATPTTEEVPNEVRKWVRDFDALILERHGSLTLGSDLDDAVDKLERMEHVAEITFKARLLGPLRPLSEERIRKVQAAAQSLGLPRRKLLESPCELCNACPSSRVSLVASTGERDLGEMIRTVSAQVSRSIQGGGRGH